MYDHKLREVEGVCVAATREGGQRSDRAILVAKEGDYGACKLLGDIRELCIEFEELMHDKFQMSSMGELTFFFGLQVKQKSDGIFISQDKYVDETLRKFKYADVMPASTPMDKEKALLKDSDGDDVDFISIENPHQERMSVLGCRLISWQFKKQTVVAISTTEAEFVAAASCYGQFWRTASTRTLNNGEIELNATIDGQDKTIIEASARRHLKMVDAGGISTLPTTEIFEQLALMGPIQARPKRLSNLPNQPPLGEGNTSQSGEGSMQLLELMDICIKLSDKVTTLENELKSTKAVYNKALITLTKRIKKLEKKLKHKRRKAVVDSLKDEEASLNKEDSPK
uniref:Copia protein n=1 Tax=Tanacetum cinerariifolium TaxID=118510 RepID=A0A6L2NKK6_TANCI|nr:copia protein [Tanacetum cinerariifolium]